jgi:hypothetical protein
MGLHRAGKSVSLRTASVAMPFYGDLLARTKEDKSALRRHIDPDARTRSATKVDATPPPASIEGEFLAEIAKKQGRRIDKDDLHRGPGGSTMRALSTLIPSELQARCVDWALSQVAAYLTRPEIRTTIGAMADGALRDAHSARNEGDQRLVVVGHSLGSVVALEALRRWQGSPVDLFVTIGSPLSVQCIHSRLERTSQPWPEKVRHWVNVADKDDVIALYGAIDRRNLFSSCASSNLHQRADVLNILDVRNHMENHHGIAGYLDDPVVARLITAFPE